MSNPSPPGNGGPPTFTQDVRHANVAARVPEKAARGVFSTGVLVLQWHTEFVLDFIQRLSHPHQLAARVVVPVVFLPRFVGALRDNLDLYRKTYGAPPPGLPAPPPPITAPSIDEIYDGLKIADEALGGVYANAAQVSHSPAEFCFDFITDFYPRAVVTARVFLSAPQVPVLVNTLAQAWQKYETKLRGEQPKPPPG